MTLRFEHIGIRGWGSLSPLGSSAIQASEAYRSAQSLLTGEAVNGDLFWAGKLTQEGEQMIDQLRLENKHYQRLDRSVLMAMSVARQAVKSLPEEARENCGVFIGSSRGATETWEKEHQKYLADHQHKAHPLTSPLTTLGNLSYWVAQDLNSRHYHSSLSITCSTSLHALINACLWLENGSSRFFIAGGSEAALTPFTMAQMKAIRALHTGPTVGYPCRSMDWDKKENTMVLGEGASALLLEQNPAQENVVAWIEQIGMARENIQGHTSIDPQGEGLYQAMSNALDGVDPRSVDAVVLHAPGTRAGDRAEWQALDRLFGNSKPALTSNKWKIGHALGASGMLSLEMALYMLKEQYFIQNPLYSCKQSGPINRVLVNAIGFGGNAISVLIRRK